MNDLGLGGAEKSLMTLLKVLDYSKYNVDLFLFKHQGNFIKELPKNVNLLNEPENYKYFEMPLKKAILKNLKKGNLKIIFYRLLVLYIYKFEKNAVLKEQKRWKYLKKAIKPLIKRYDFAIGFLEKTPNYFCVDHVNAKIKIGSIRTDYEEMGMDKTIDFPYFKKLNYLLTNSETNELTLKKIFPSLTSKIKTLNNIFPVQEIKKLASEKIEILHDKNAICIVSIGRLNPVKRFDLAINACKIVKDKVKDIKWYTIGEGEERKQLEFIIAQNKLEDTFILLGKKDNPYPYLKMADVYVHTSAFEGKSRVIEEAKILNKAIVVTYYPTVEDQIKHLETGFIVEMTKESIADGVLELIDNKDLALKLRNYKYGIDNEKHLKVLYDIIEN